MGGMKNICGWLCRAALCTLFPCCVAYGFASKDLLDARKLTKELKLSSAQQDSATQKITAIKSVLETFEWDYAKMTCEAAVWKGERPPLEALKERKKKAYTDVDSLFHGFREGLDKAQQTHLDDMTKALDGLLDIHLNDKIPFYYVDTRPLFARLENERVVNYTTFSDPPETDPSWTYAAVLKTWTARTYLSASGGEDSGQMPGIGETPDLAIRTLPSPGQIKGKLVNSPLVVAATLMSPDLVEAEVQHLHQYYNPEGKSLESIRQAYQAQNRVGDAILIRLKMATPNAAAFLSPKNWTIYLEDNSGAGYEPVEVRTEAVRPIEAIKLEVPGQTYEVQDVFGNYYPYIPGEKTYLTEKTERVTYVGNEALVKVFFPLHNLRGIPLITPEVSSLKLIIKPSDSDTTPYPAEAVWKFRKPKKS